MKIDPDDPRTHYWVLLAALVLLALAFGLLACSAKVYTHYAPDEDGRWHAACRLWETRVLIQGQTVTACIVGSESAPEATGETVAAVWARGWEHEAKGGDQVAAGGDAEGSRESEARTTEAGRVELPIVGPSGVAYASRDDDVGLEMGSILRWATVVWGWVATAGEAAGVLD